MADNTWKFLEHQESNPEALKQAVDTLIGYTKKWPECWQLSMLPRKIITS